MESKMKHTPEPWHAGGNGTIIYDKDGWGVASVTTYHGSHNTAESKANAERIVACVNACKHYTDEDLEDVGENLSGVFADVKARCAELVEQRDQAVRALISGGYTLAGGAQEWKPPTGPSASPLLDRIDGLTAQRDELLAAIEGYLPYMPNSTAKNGGACSHSEMLRASDRLKGAFAKCEVQS